MSVSYIDAHVHLQDPRLQGNLASILAECRSACITRWVINGTCEKDWDLVRNLADAHPEIAPSFGLHPWHVSSRSDEWLAILEQQLQRGAVGVGEIGLDRWVRGHDLPDQKRVFKDQLALAVKYHLPATIHCLKAWGHLLQCLQSTGIPSRGFLLHSYAGPREMVAPLVSLGAYFSLSGYFFHQHKRSQLETLLHAVPADRLLLETDAPDMPLPEHQDNSFNHPVNLANLYLRVSQELNEPIDHLAGRMLDNFTRLFA